MAPNCYKRTEYCYVIRKLCDKARNSYSTEKCPKCLTEIDSYHALMIHIERSHPNDIKHKPFLKLAPQIEEPISQNVEDFVMANEDFETVNDNLFLPQANELPIADSSTLNELKDNLFFQELMNLMFKFKFDLCLPHSHANEVVSSMLSLFKSYRSSNYLTEESLDLCTKVAKSDHLQNVYKDHALTHHIEPEMIPLINSEGTKIGSYSYIPIRKLISKYLSNRSILHHLISETKLPFVYQPAQFTSILDGEANTKRLKGKLKIELYFDDCQLAPSGMFASSRQKHLMVYMTFADLPFKFRTSMKEIEVLMIANRAKLKLLPENGLPVLLNKLKSELESNRFVTVFYNGSPVTVEVAVSNINGDNLQINEILGFKQSFNNNAFVCRFCGVTGNERQSNDTIHHHDRIYKLLFEIPPNLSPAELKTQFGVMRPFVFDNFNNINRFNICPPDLAHDLAEGVVLETLLLILRSMVINHHLNQQNIVQMIEDYEKHFYEGKAEVKPESYNSFSIKSKAVQNLEIFLKLPAIFYNVINTNWAEYQLYSKLKEFILITFSSMITRSQIVQLKKLSFEIINLLNDVSSSIGVEYKIHCKVHHLTHYSDLIVHFGPLFLFSTFRFERKHQFSKNLCRKIRNTRNVAYTLHTRHQIQRAFEDQKLNIHNFNFFPPLPERTVYYMNPPSDTLVKLGCKEHPFRLNKQVIRRSISGRNEWLYVDSFYKDEDNVIWCQGRMCSFFYDRSKSIERHPTNGLQRLRLQTVKKFAELGHLEPNNDYFHYQDNKYWLLEWI